MSSPAEILPNIEIIVNGAKVQKKKIEKKPNKC